jgi:hypothetical protein
MPPAILLGLGFTTRRLAKRLLLRRLPAFAVVRHPERFLDLRLLGLLFNGFPKQAVLVHTIPPLPPEETEEVRRIITLLEPRRVVYISSTGVYGDQSEVNESSPPAPSDPKGARRIEEETWLQSGPWETLIVRAAAIYGPGRGVHVRIQEGRAPRAEPTGITSRIHVDDLAAVLEAGVLSTLTGAWPIADQYPCSTPELAAWCGALLRRELVPAWRNPRILPGRSVDGTKILDLLGVPLTYPDYRSGILASLAESAAMRERQAAKGPANTSAR